MKKVFLSSLATLFLLSAVNAAEFEIDKTHSNVNFKIKHFGINNVSGSFTDFGGVIDFDNNTINKMSATIKTASVDTNNEKRDEHLRSADFFDVAKFSDMKFQMKEFKKDGDVIGDLTLNGVTKSVKLEYEFGGKTAGTNGKERIGFSLEGKIKRSDFNFANGFANNAVLGDEVKISIEVQAVAK